LSCFCLNWSL